MVELGVSNQIIAGVAKIDDDVNVNDAHQTIFSRWLDGLRLIGMTLCGSIACR